MDWKITLIRIGIAIFVGTIIGIEREYKNRPAGMRTHVLVCLGACMIALIESWFIAGIGDLSDPRVTYSFGRVSAQVVCGVGFLGAGTIFTARKKITGLTTAASLWNVACLGLAVGYGYYLIALFGSVFVVIVLLIMQRIVRVNAMKRVEIRFVHRVETITFLNEYFESLGIKTLDLDFTVESHGETNLYTNIYTLKLPSKIAYTDIITHISEHPNIESVRTTNT